MAPDIVDPVVISNKQTSKDQSTIEQKAVTITNNNGLHNRKLTGIGDSSGTPAVRYDAHQNDTNCDTNENVTLNSDEKEVFRPSIRWPDLIVQIFLHVGAFYGFLFLFWTIKLYTFFWCKFNNYFSSRVHYYSK